jgi:hypothetical protein
MRVYSTVLERQRRLIEDAFAAIAPEALAHRRAFRDQVVDYMRAAHGLEVGPAPAGIEAGAGTDVAPVAASFPPPDARDASGAGATDAGSFLIFSARSDVLPRGYYEPGVSLYQQFAFADLGAAHAFMAERTALGENVYVRAVPASAAGLGQTLVFSEYPDIAMTAFHEALHNRIQLPLAIEEPLHTLLAVALTQELAASLPMTTEAEQRLARWVAEGARELRQRFARSASRYQAWLASIEPDHPDPRAINQYALELLAAFRSSRGSDAQQRHGRTDTPPYRTPSLLRDLRIASLEPAELGLIGTAFVADHSTYERRFVEVYQLLESCLELGRIGTVLEALLDHIVPAHERWAFDSESEERAIAWLTETLEAIPGGIGCFAVHYCHSVTPRK